MQPLPIAATCVRAAVPSRSGGSDRHAGRPVRVAVAAHRWRQPEKTGGLLDLVVVASGDGRHSPCLRAVRVYAPRFCYQDEHCQRCSTRRPCRTRPTRTTPASPPDFRERLLANLEGLLTPIENRVVAAEYLLDPYATPVAMLPWLGSYLGRALDPGWPEARQRRAIAAAGRQLRQRAAPIAVCLAVDIATDGAVAR